MKLPELPEPTIVDGRILFTKNQLREYGKLCYAAGTWDREEPEESPHQKNGDSAVEDIMNMFGMKR